HLPQCGGINQVGVALDEFGECRFYAMFGVITQEPGIGPRLHLTQVITDPARIRQSFLFVYERCRNEYRHLLSRARYTASLLCAGRDLKISEPMKKILRPLSTISLLLASNALLLFAAAPIIHAQPAAPAVAPAPAAKLPFATPLQWKSSGVLIKP